MRENNFFQRTVKCILYVFCLAAGGVLMAYTNSKYLLVAGGVLMIAGMVSVLRKDLLPRILFIAGVCAAVMMIFYNVKTFYPYIKMADSTEDLSLTQLNIPNQEWHKDMWITPVIRNKTVNLAYADEWCREFFVQFAGSVTEEKETSVLTLSEEEKQAFFYPVGSMVLTAYESLFTEEVLENMTLLEELPQLYLDIRGLVETSEIFVLSDDEFNLYLLSKEEMEALLKGRQKQ